MYETEVFEDGNQSIGEEATPVEEESAPVEEVETEEEAPTEESAPVDDSDQFDVIKYNKEEVRIPVAERQNYLQKGYNYDKVSERATQFEQNLQRVAKFSGFNDVESFMQAVEAQQEEQRIEEAAQRMGIDASAVKEYISPMEKKLSEYEQKFKAIEAEDFNRGVVSAINELKADEKYKDFDEHATAIFEKMQDLGLRPTKAGFATAYRDVTYDKMQQGIEQKVLSNVAARDGKTVLSSSDKPAGVNFDINSMSSEEFKKFEEEMTRKMYSGERVTW